MATVDVEKMTENTEKEEDVMNVDTLDEKAAAE